VLEGTTRDTLAGLPSVVWMVTVMLSMFWCFFVFDMMGDVYGVNVGALVLLLPSFGTIFAHCAAAFYNSKILFPRDNTRDNGTTLTKSLLLESGDIGLNESFDSNNSRL
jgi:apolipoprotein N-acyltransferase